MRFGAQLWSQQHVLAGVPRRRARRRGGRLGLGLDVGPPPRDLRARGSSRSSRAGRPWRRRRGHERVRLGLMVGANTFRNPGLTAKLATTLDHVSGGRAVLGIGGAWFEREHEAFGFEPGAGLRRAPRPARRGRDAPAPPARRRADRRHEGRFYTMRDALCAPRPVQAHLPILIGGSGPKKTLRTPAATRRRVEHVGHSSTRSASASTILDEHCAAVGRDRGRRSS